MYTRLSLKGAYKSQFRLYKVIFIIFNFTTVAYFVGNFILQYANTDWLTYGKVALVINFLQKKRNRKFEL